MQFLPRSLWVLLWLYALIAGSIALIAQGDFGNAGIALLILAMIVMVATSPFAGMAPPQRRLARFGTTGLVLAGWFAAGYGLWDWDGEAYGVAGAIALFALWRSVSIPAPTEQRTA